MRPIVHSHQQPVSSRLSLEGLLPESRWYCRSRNGGYTALQCFSTKKKKILSSNLFPHNSCLPCAAWSVGHWLRAAELFWILNASHGNCCLFSALGLQLKFQLRKFPFCVLLELQLLLFFNKWVVSRFNVCKEMDIWLPSYLWVEVHSLISASWGVRSWRPALLNGCVIIPCPL